MHIRGQWVHIAGSADRSIDPSLLRYAYELVTELVKALIVEGQCLSRALVKILYRYQTILAHC